VMPANSVPVPEDRRGPITGLPSGIDYACIKRFFLMLPPWMTTLTWLAAPTAEAATWRSFAGKTFRTVDRLLCQREAALAQPTTDATEGRAPHGHGPPRAVDPSNSSTSSGDPRREASGSGLIRSAFLDPRPPRSP